MHEGDIIDVMIDSPSGTDDNKISRLVLIKIGEYDSDADRIPIILRKYSTVNKKE